MAFYNMGICVHYGRDKTCGGVLKEVVVMIEYPEKKAS